VTGDGDEEPKKVDDEPQKVDEEPKKVLGALHLQKKGSSSPKKSSRALHGDGDDEPKKVLGSVKF